MLTVNDHVDCKPILIYSIVNVNVLLLFPFVSLLQPFNKAVNDLCIFVMLYP